MVTPLRSSSLASNDSTRLSSIQANRVVPTLNPKDYIGPYNVHSSQPHITPSALQITTLSNNDQKLAKHDKSLRYRPSHRDIINARLFSDKAQRLQKLYVGSLNIISTTKLKKPQHLQPLRDNSLPHIRPENYILPEIHTGP
jgi:hypothetical protein